MLQRALRNLFSPFLNPPAEPLPISDDPRVFFPTEDGSGVFGRWTLDSNGLPAYDYTCDQYNDRRAHYPTSDGLDHRDHWHQLGNDRVTAFAANDGTVQVYLGDCGGVFLNFFQPDPGEDYRGCVGFFRRIMDAINRWLWQRQFEQVITAQQKAGSPRGTATFQPTRLKLTQEEESQRVKRYAYVGGYSYVDDGTEAWATAYRYRPNGAETRRVFGLGYFEMETTYRNIRVTRRVYAPYGDEPVLLADVKIENLGTSPVDLRHYEYWDVNVHQLRLQWVRTGVFSVTGDQRRCTLNEEFTPGIAADPPWQALRFRQQPPPDAPPPDEISDMNWYPADVFLADLSGTAASCYTDKFAFFGNGTANLPEAVRERRDGEIGAPSTDSMPYCMVLRRDLHLDPGQSIDLRYAYGTVLPDQPLDFLADYRSGDILGQTLASWKDLLAYFSTGHDPALQREMAWHAYNLLSATVCNSYYDAHLTPQGSAYLFLHGADGAPRDQALFTMPMTYVRPDLAQNILKMIMRLQHADTCAFPYAFAGYGYHSDAEGLHSEPSDLDLFFLLALNEYLAATGDMAFLDMEVPFYPIGEIPVGIPGETVLDHVRTAVNHLFQDVRTGDHGLIRIGDGDWSDAVVVESAIKHPLSVNFDNSKANGESIPNTQMACYVLPLTAALVETRDPALAEQLRAALPGLKQAAEAQWTGRWFTRAILRDHFNNPYLLDRDRINLESQPWALIAGLNPVPGWDTALINAILEYLDGPSPIGATLLPKGMVWPAISQLLTWGYMRARPDLAWNSLCKNTFYAHSEVFPDVWINTWSGPDGVNGSKMTNAGGTWASPVTPMTDFPVMNANQDAMALLGLLRVCGIEPSPGGDGLVIAPKGTPESFTLETPLLRLDVAPGKIAGEYRAFVDGNRVLRIQPPPGVQGIEASARGTPVNTAPADSGEVDVPITFTAGETVPFEVRWAV